jgi:ubiquitin-conjugating enzyme E2 J1
MPLKDKGVKRVMKEISEYQASREKHIFRLAYDDSNLQMIYPIIRGLDGDYTEGEYILRIKLPDDYPFSPPVIACMTPTGRFEPETNICLNITHMHSETWSPLITLEKMIYSVISVLYDKDITGIGSVVTSHETKKTLATASREYNRKHFAKILGLEK